MAEAKAVTDHLTVEGASQHQMIIALVPLTIARCPDFLKKDPCPKSLLYANAFLSNIW